MVRDGCHVWAGGCEEESVGSEVFDEAIGRVKVGIYSVYSGSVGAAEEGEQRGLRHLLSSNRPRCPRSASWKGASWSPAGRASRVQVRELFGYVWGPEKTYFCKGMISSWGYRGFCLTQMNCMVHGTHLDVLLCPNTSSKNISRL